jgi:transcription elongation GreA/GreB family factor
VRTSGGYEKAKDAALNAAGAMQSKSDTTKSQQGALANGIAGLVEEAQVGISKLFAISFVDAPDCVSAGTVVSVREGNADGLYFVMPYGGGEEFNYDGKKFSVVTPTSPLGQALRGRKVGDTCVVRAPGGNRLLEIYSID